MVQGPLHQCLLGNWCSPNTSQCSRINVPDHHCPVTLASVAGRSLSVAKEQCLLLLEKFEVNAYSIWGSLETRESSISPVPAPLMADTGNGSKPVFQNSAACISAFAGLSHLLTASTTGFLECDLRSQSRISSSPAVRPTLPSTTKMILWDS